MVTKLVFHLRPDMKVEDENKVSEDTNLYPWEVIRDVDLDIQFFRVDLSTKSNLGEKFFDTFLRGYTKEYWTAKVYFGSSKNKENRKIIDELKTRFFSLDNCKETNLNVWMLKEQIDEVVKTLPVFFGVSLRIKGKCRIYNPDKKNKKNFYEVINIVFEKIEVVEKAKK